MSAATPHADANVRAQLDLTGKTVLITGATGHLGSAMAAGLAEAGASVVVSSRRLAEAQRVAESLPREKRSDAGAAPTHAGVEIDHMDEGSIERGFDAAL